MATQHTWDVRRLVLILFSTGSLYTYGLGRVFALASSAGYDGIELIVDHRWDTRDVVHLRQLSRQHGLPIKVLHSPFVSGVVGWPHDQLGRLERTVSLAQQLDVHTVVTHLPFRLSGIRGRWFGRRPRPFRLLVPWLQRGEYVEYLAGGHVGQLEESTGVTVAVENMPAQRFLGKRINAFWFNTPLRLAQFAHLTLDTTHLGTWGLEPVDVYAQLGRRIVHVHVANYDGREHRLPDDGHLALDALLRQLAADGYEGAVTVEATPSAMAVEDEGRCLADLQRALAFCREHLSR